MNELESIKEIGIKEVARKTHIEPIFLQYIVDKNFEKLVRLNARGYIKILQREYNLELSLWLEEYEAFLNEHKPQNVNSIKINPKIPAYTSDTTSARKSRGSFSWLAWLVILFALGGGVYYFEAYKYLENLPSLFEDENRSAVYSDSSIVNEVKQNIKEANITITKTQFPQDENLTKEKEAVESNVAKLAPKIEQNASTIVINIEQNLDQNVGTQSSALERLTTSITEPKDKNVTAPTAVIVPKQRVWIGVINLENDQKISRDSSENLTIDLSKRQLIVCGNGQLELKVGDKISKFAPGKAVRLLVENGEIKPITYDEFIMLNKGKTW
ncbi:MULTISPECIES: phosphatidylglycerophosphate synthase [Campylobacter]|uniref:phosphatidylglycerophosphate synthase n=1 Tax=Campylobacter TaxID=194 RepID=UPI00147517AF|nr:MULTISPECIES: phosphatidylglycerophosphate synthase [unclassified Campylobacter]MBE3021634.1 phosphatidylglycerophosphate synthase [Campylobacter sp. 7477a]MBE3610158.1 phosphatidylglycerophosphate synthase [Campylobacter sp. RM12916]